jgi:SAM-dependent methyltransferase
MTQPTNLLTDSYRATVVEYLKQYEGNFNYDVMLAGYLDAGRFESSVAEVGVYRPIAGSVVFSSGCGSAGDLLAFMQAGASRAYGIEVSDSLANVARARFKGTELEPVVQIDAYDGLKLPYSDALFDIVYSTHVIEHTRNPRLYLNELFHVLKPGGVIFLEAPNRYYKIEQHTELPYLHIVPLRLRDLFLKIRLSPPFSKRLSADLRYKLETYKGIHFPSAGQIMHAVEAARATHNLIVRDAFFHTYGGQRVDYRPCPGKYLFGAARTRLSFRLVVAKQARAQEPVTRVSRSESSSR